MNQSKEIAQNYQLVIQELKPPTQLIAVSKTFSAEDVKVLYDLGHRDFGENKVQELESKARELAESCPEIKWHFIGHLQSNKINKLLMIPHLVSIHSIDSIQILNKIVSSKTDRLIGLFLQVNTSGETEKYGMGDSVELEECVALLQANLETKLFLQGLMTIGPIRTTDFEQETKDSFLKLKSLRDDLAHSFNLKNLQLSMGMSSDYKWAMEYETNWVRIGSKIFGTRK
jgi:pyridoxal phosphate enzyme (YggS family)